jgi:hypothetical protein
LGSPKERASPDVSFLLVPKKKEPAGIYMTLPSRELSGEFFAFTFAVKTRAIAHMNI